MRTLRVLYLFAGAQRKADVREHLQDLCRTDSVGLHFEEIDVLRDPIKHNLLDDSVWQSVLDQISAKKFDVVITTPPCDTFSRVQWSNSAGPRPVRSRQYPWGFPWLSGKNLKRCEAGNTLVRRSFEAMWTAFQAKAGTLLEHPEDLGQTDTAQPASIWCLPEYLELHKKMNIISGALHQCQFGTDYSKPTRLAGTLRGLGRLPYVGLPVFNRSGRYLGPLPRSCGHVHQTKLVGTENGVFRTKPTSSYPPRMCRFLAEMVWEHFQSSSQQRCAGGSQLQEELTDMDQTQKFVPVGEVFENVFENNPVETEAAPEEGSTSEEDEDGDPKPKLQDHLGGGGNAMSVFWSGKQREMHDGAGLCSPGRWPPERRKMNSSNFCLMLRFRFKLLLRKHLTNHREVILKLAVGKFDSSPFPDLLIEEARADWFKTLREDDCKDSEIMDQVQPNQPFFLVAIRESLRLSGDPDWKFFEKLRRGVPVTGKYPRTPAVFERKKKWRKLDETDFKEDMSNYKSVSGIEHLLEEQFVMEEAEGLMYRMSEEEARERFPDLRVAAQGAISKSDGTFRVVHDGTHGVRVNHEIKVRDQTRMPTIANMKACMEYASDIQGPHLSVQLDVKKAHRRFLHLEDHHGMLACRLQQGTIWFSRVGTFGVGCAGYYWGREAAGIARLAWYVNNLVNMWQLLYADDLRITAEGKDKDESLLLMMLIWVVCGTPFSWPKTKGGLVNEWVGYMLDYARFEVGISEKRCYWLILWIKDIVDGKSFLVRAMAEGLGRLSYCCGALEYGRPFLGPVFAWVAAAPSGAFLPAPAYVRLTLRWVSDQLQRGKRMVSVRRPAQGTVMFKADAKGEDHRVVLGGYEIIQGQLGRWFSFEVSQEEAPWLFKKRKSSSTISAGELLASLTCILLFVDEGKDERRMQGTVAVTGATDNLGHSYIVSKHDH